MTEAIVEGGNRAASRKATQSEDVAPKKKGTAADWKKGGRLAKLNVPKGYVGRWVDKDPANIQKKLEEGWQFVNGTTSPTSQQVGNDAPDKAHDGTGIGSAIQYKEMVGMMLPEKGAGQTKESRDAYYAEENRKAIESRVSLSKEKSRGGIEGKFAKNFTPTMTID